MSRLTIQLSHKVYPIEIEGGLMGRVGYILKERLGEKKIFMIIDATVDRLYGQDIEKDLQDHHQEIKKIVIQPGEVSKSFTMVQAMIDQLLTFGITRGDLIVTIGGGVVGDLGGFVASILLRGIPYVQIPTTLTAQIDSSIGGKVGINLPQGKNLVGSFYHPEAVLIDPELLTTLPKDVFNDGMAEVIKCGAIRDARLFQTLLDYQSREELYDDLEEIVHTCCSIKKELVEADDNDQGVRMLLNFGHTLGHALEQQSKYQGLSHGQAVAIGMYAITTRTEALGITEQGSRDALEQLLTKYDLPYQLPSLDQGQVLKSLAKDKKQTSSGIHLIVLNRIGEAVIRTVQIKQLAQYFWDQA